MTQESLSPTKSLYRGTQVVWYLLFFVEFILAFRFVLRLLGANPGAPFTNFMYSLSYPFVVPFQAVFPSTRVEGSSFEWTTLLAMVVYWIIALGIIKLFVMARPVSQGEAKHRLHQQDSM